MNYTIAHIITDGADAEEYGHPRILVLERERPEGPEVEVAEFPFNGDEGVQAGVDDLNDRYGWLVVGDPRELRPGYYVAWVERR